MSGKRPGRAKKKAEAKGPSANTLFEMKIRADRGLSVTTRALWLLTALSHGGHTYMKQEDMAKQLDTSVWQLRSSLRIIVKNGYFRPGQQPGIHRPRQYHRVYWPEETPKQFVARIQSDDRWDICALLHWIACDEVAKTKGGIAQFAAPAGWNVSRDALKKARRKMRRLGHFAVDGDPKTGTPATYRKITQADGDKKEQQHDKPPADARPVKAPVVEKVDDGSHEIDDANHRDDQRRREFEDSEFADTPARPIRRPEEKRVRVVKF